MKNAFDVHELGSMIAPRLATTISGSCERVPVFTLGGEMKRLEGKVAVVTGGNSGIGLATAKRLQEEGARVVISGRNQKTLDEAVKTIGNGVLSVKADVSVGSDLDKLYATVSKKFGKIDVLFANA